MNGLFGALGLLTVLPTSRRVQWQGPAMLPWFPVVGMILGALWTGFDAAVGLVFPSALRGGLDVLFLILLTGGLHLDGLADSADGLLSHQDRHKALEIMKDSRIGTWGVLALMAVLGFKTLALSQPLQGFRSVALLIVPVYGRLAMLSGIWILPYGRKKDGIAHELFKGGSRLWWIPGILLAGLGSALLNWPCALLINGVFVAVLGLLMGFFWMRVGCITGDMLGAVGEITETSLLVALVTVSSC